MPKFKANDRVFVKIHKVLGEVDTRKHWGNDWKTIMVVGTILSVERTGKSQYKYDVAFVDETEDLRGKKVKIPDAKGVHVSSLQKLTAKQLREAGPPAPATRLPQVEARSRLAGPTVNDPMVAHGLKWVQTEAVAVDFATMQFAKKPRYTGETLFVNPHPNIPVHFPQSQDKVAYFLAMFPHELDGTDDGSFLLASLALTNQQFTLKMGDKNQKHYQPLGVSEFFKWLGIVYAMTKWKFGRRRELWKTVGWRLRDAPAFGMRYGMSRNRFEAILANLTWFGGDEEGDKWAPVRGLFASFNQTRAQNVSPGPFIIVDESMSAWRGKDGNFCSDGLPHVTKIKRKPKGVGTEIKDAADVSTGVRVCDHPG